MSTEPEHKAKKEPFTYSWYIPVSEGGTPTEAQHPDPAAEPQPEPEKERRAESAQTFVGPSRKQMANRSRRLKETSGHQLIVSPSLLQIVGLSSWSIISGVGMIALLVTQTPFPMTQVIAVGALWAVVSVLIWFLPGKLPR